MARGLPARELNAADVHSDLFVTNLVQKMMVYALGRAVDYRDMPAVRTICRQAQRENLRFSALVLACAERAVPSADQRVAGQRSDCPRVSKTVKETAMANFITRRHLSRRALLRGAGAALRCRCSTRWSRRWEAARIRRLASGHLLPARPTMSRWTPPNDGADFTFSEILQPCTLSLAHQCHLRPGSSARLWPGATGNHNRSSAAFLSGAKAAAGLSRARHHRGSMLAKHWEATRRCRRWSS